MNPVAVDPQTRINRLLFHPAALYDHVMHIGIYTCPHCGAPLRFNTSDFERHFSSTQSNLEPEVRRAFDEYRPLNVQMWDCFLDFHCHSCGAPARIIYEPFEYRMGSYYYKLTSIVEAESWNHVPAGETLST